MGQVRLVTGKLGEATRCYEESLRISREAGDKSIEASSLNVLGGLNNWTGEYEQALHLHEQAFTIGHTHNLQFLLLGFSFMRGVPHCGKGEYEQAIVSLQEGLELSERLSDKI
jgi:tetratricopeptide (TPR) repeat protein